MRLIRFASRSAFLLLFAFWLFIQAAAANATLPLFEEQAPLDAVLSVPLKSIYSQKSDDERAYTAGTFTYKGANGDTIRVPLKVKSRGNFRRQNCTLPPLRLDFPKGAVKETLLHGQNKVKLVGPCHPGGIFKNLVGLEHLAYEIYALVSDISLETRLLNLNYVDTSDGLKPRKTNAFVIEDISDLAKRVNMKAVEPDRAARSELDLDATALIEIFALFIGNNDYSTLIGMPGEKCCHNMKMLKPKGEESKLIPVPYDFDMSGLVDAPYATPPGTVPIRSVRQRYFNGWCKADVHYQTAIDTFRSKRAQINALVDQSELLTKGIKKRTKKYFDDFFELVDSPERFETEIVGRCRGQTYGEEEGA